MKQLLVTGGIGDAWAVESHLETLPDEILLATPQADTIAACFRAIGVKTKTIATDRVYFNINQVEAYHGSLDDVEDGSIGRTFHLIRDGIMKYRGSRLLELPHARPIEEKYAVLCPASANFGNNRNMTQDEVLWCLRQTDLPIVALFKGNYALPHSPRLRNQINKTDILQTIGILKHASMFFGVDSCQTVLACQVGYPCVIKSVSEHYYKWKKVYAAPYHREIRIMSRLDGRSPIKPLLGRK